MRRSKQQQQQQRQHEQKMNCQHDDNNCYTFENKQTNNRTDDRSCRDKLFGTTTKKKTTQANLLLLWRQNAGMNISAQQMDTKPAQ